MKKICKENKHKKTNNNSNNNNNNNNPNPTHLVNEKRKIPPLVEKREIKNQKNVTNFK